jgi:4-hydroxybenzoate polyprenyltransferase
VPLERQLAAIRDAPWSKALVANSGAEHDRGILPSVARRMSRWRDWLQLVRLPNVFTALADPLAGALVVGATWRDTPSILLVMLAGACLYAGGIALNDWNDYKRDLKERPHRPLPSGRIRRMYALGGALLLLGAGTGIGMLLGGDTRTVAILLALAIVSYDILVKHLPIAPGVMGLCRGLNLLLGMTVIGDLGLGPANINLYLVTMLIVYVTGITLVARRETDPQADRLMWGGAITTWTGVMGVALLHLLYPQTARHVVGLLWSAPLIFAVGYKTSQALLTPAPQTVQAAVKTTILCIIVMDAAMVAFTRGLLPSLLVIVLLLPAMRLGRWLYST